MKKETAIYLGSAVILFEDIQFLIVRHHDLFGFFPLDFKWSLIVITILNLSFFPYVIYYFKMKDKN